MTNETRFGEQGLRWINWLVKTASDERMTEKERLIIISSFPVLEDLPRMLWVPEEPSEKMIEAAEDTPNLDNHAVDVRLLLRNANLASSEKLYPRMFSVTENIVDFFEDITGVCMASRYEQSSLWERNHEKRSWKSQANGLMATIGRVEDMPICLSIFKVKIDNKVIGFCEITSQMVDHRICDDWFKKHFPNLTVVDADNFRQVL